MTERVIFRPTALADANAAAAYYEASRPGLGDRFLRELSNLLERIAERPLQFPVVESSVRRGLLQRFPYGVYFVVEQQRIVVIAVLHLHRDPDAWKRTE